MEEEEVIDHGDATYDDSQRMMADVESLGFEAFLINSLRLLVGAEIFREREIFYLPLPGEEPVRRREPASSSASKQPLLASGPSSLKAEAQVFSSTESESSSEDGSDYEDEKVPAAKKARAMRVEKGETQRPAADTAHAGPSHPHKPTTARLASQKRPRHDGMEAEDGRPSKKAKPQIISTVSISAAGTTDPALSPLSPISEKTQVSLQ